MDSVCKWIAILAGFFSFYMNVDVDTEIDATQD